MFLTDDQEIENPEPLLRRTAASWEKARKLADLIGPVSPLFQAAIRLIIKSDEADENTRKVDSDNLSIATAGFLIRVSPSLQAMFYYAAEQIHEEKLKQIEDLNVRKLIPLFTPREVASIVGLAYLHRSVKRRCDPEEWKILSRRMYIGMEVGAIIGETIDNIERSYGMLIGGLRHLSLAIFSIQDLKQFQAYRQKIEKQSQLFDLEQEESIWGCNHLEISSLLIQSLGFGALAPVGICYDSFQKGDMLSKAEELQLLCWREAVRIIGSYNETGKAPDDICGLSESDEMFVPREISDDLRSRVAASIQEGTGFNWLERERNDLPEELQKSLVMSLSELLEYEQMSAEETGPPKEEDSEDSPLDQNSIEPAEDEPEESN